MKKFLLLVFTAMVCLMASWLPVAAASGTILMVVPPRQFQDDELFIPKKTFEAEGYKVKLASSTTAEATGMKGGSVKPDISLDQVEVNSYAAVVFVGGSGAIVYWNDSKALKIAKEAFTANKVVAAICLAPITLAEAGLLQGKPATVWEGSRYELERNGALYENKDVVRSGKIITANGPQSASKFAQTVIKVLKENR